MSLFETYNLPFAIALMLLVFVAAIQILGLADLFEGGDAELDLAADYDAGTDAGSSPGGFMDGLLSVFGLGRVPFLIWLSMLLFIYAAIGVSGQALVQSLFGTTLDPLAAGALAGVAALPINGLAVRPVAAIMPRDETSAVTLSSLIRRDAVIQTGTAKLGSPARSKVLDRFGQPHFVMVEPHDPTLELAEGETVLIVRRDGETFYAMRYENPLLGPE